MILQPIHGQLTPNNCTIILMKYQIKFALTFSSADRDIVMHNAINLAKMAKNHASAYGLEIRYAQSGLDR